MDDAGVEDSRHSISTLCDNMDPGAAMGNLEIGPFFTNEFQRWFEDPTSRFPWF